MEFIINSFQKILEIQEIQTFLKLILIVILSGFVGYERESYNKPAGFRTYVLVGISATLVMICGKYINIQTGADPTRIPAQLLSGIGFLGAGTILRDGFNVKGLTTAAGLLAITCIGLAVGAGYYMGAIIATAVVYIVLAYSHVLSETLEHYNFLELEITAKSAKKNLDKLKEILINHELEIIKLKIVDDKETGDLIKVLTKYKYKLDVNEIMSSIMKLHNVIEIVEVKDR